MPRDFSRRSILKLLSGTAMAFIDHALREG